jgi:hypothetical protein
MKDTPLFTESKKSYSRRRLTGFTFSLLLSFGFFIVINSCYFIIFSKEVFWFVPMIILLFCCVFLYFTVIKFILPIQKVILFEDRFSPSIIPLYKWIIFSPVYIEYNSVVSIKKNTDVDAYGLIIYLKNNKKAIIVKEVNDSIKEELMNLINKRLEK